MTIYVDGDACPVKDIIIDVANEFKIPVHLFIDTSHTYNNPNIIVTIVDKGPDSVDFAIMKYIQKDDILITQDYGLSSLALTKEAFVLHPSGKIINIYNIDTLLVNRYLNKIERKINNHVKGPRKRTQADDDTFKESLIRLLKSKQS